MDFDDAYFRGFIRSIENWLQLDKTRLLAFNEILKHISIQGQYDAGIQEIEIDAETNLPIGKIECSIRKKNAEMVFGIFENMFEIQIEKKI